MPFYWQCVLPEAACLLQKRASHGNELFGALGLGPALAKGERVVSSPAVHSL